MGKTKIPWVKNTDGSQGETLNVNVGCTPIASGCRNCWSEDLHEKRHKAYLAGKLQNCPQYARPFSTIQFFPERLEIPLRRRKPTTYFINSVSDLFHPDVPDEYIDEVLARVLLCQRHTFIVLTKRVARMQEYLSDTERMGMVYQEADDHVWSEGINPSERNKMMIEHTPESEIEWQGDMAFGLREVWPLPNLILGTSVSTQPEADENIKYLLQIPAACRIVSIEPMLEAVNLMRLETSTGWVNALYGFSQYVSRGESLDGIICGCESGKKRRPFNEDWARRLRDECHAAGCDFFYKQGIQGGKLVRMPLLDGVLHDSLPWVAKAEVSK
ncbi:MAG: DUF5131 family protein [Dehalococcoidia bacterium]|jgi:protein gp37